jgi:hypothetical protein
VPVTEVVFAGWEEIFQVGKKKRKTVPLDKVEKGAYNGYRKRVLRQAVSPVSWKLIKN